jgi:ribosome maturation factor RimP
MKRQDILQQVGQLVQPIAARMGLEVVDVQLAGEGGRHTVLRVLMDRPEGGITLDECARVNEALSRQLDLYDLFPSSYTLEVSSPGLDRPLKTDQDYRRFAGRRAELTTYGPVDGQRRFRGILLGVLGDSVAVQIEGRQVQLPKDQIAQARLVVELEDLRPDLKA